MNQQQEKNLAKHEFKVQCFIIVYIIIFFRCSFCPCLWITSKLCTIGYKFRIDIEEALFFSSTDNLATNSWTELKLKLSLYLLKQNYTPSSYSQKCFNNFISKLTFIAPSKLSKNTPYVQAVFYTLYVKKSQMIRDAHIPDLTRLMFLTVWDRWWLTWKI